jgi:hypothetical protein
MANDRLAPHVAMWLVAAGPLRAGSRRLASDSAVGWRLGPGRCVFFYLNSDVAPLSLRLAKTDSFGRADGMLGRRTISYGRWTQ